MFWTVGRLLEIKKTNIFYQEQSGGQDDNYLPPGRDDSHQGEGQAHCGLLQQKHRLGLTGKI